MPPKEEFIARDPDKRFVDGWSCHCFSFGTNSCES